MSRREEKILNEKKVKNKKPNSNYMRASKNKRLFAKLVCHTTNEHSNHKKLKVSTEQNIAQPEQKQ